MDMDGVGTFAMFLSSGVIGAGLIWLAAYRMKLKAGLDRDRLHGSSNDAVDELRQEMHDLLGGGTNRGTDRYGRGLGAMSQRGGGFLLSRRGTWNNG